MSIVQRGPTRLLAAVVAAGVLSAGAWFVTPAAERTAAAVSGNAEQVAGWTSPPLDVAALFAEDEARRRAGAGPRRVGYPFRTDLGPANSGAWEERRGGGWTWRLRVASPGALWTVLGFDRLRLDPGASLVVRDAAGEIVHGPLTASDAREDGALWLPPVGGDTLVLELDWPAELRQRQPVLQLTTVSHGYRPLEDRGASAPLGSGDCHNDIQCPPGEAWQDQKRGVVLLLIDGSGLCSGSLVNNTDLDCTPYVLTAEHCYTGGGTAAGTQFLFNYELPACEPGTVPADLWISGATLKFAHVPTDHRLLQMSASPPAEWDVFFNGWTSSTLPATSSVTIHHPLGDLKKITIDDDPLVDGIDQGPDHWRVVQWDSGSTDPGSSGGPLFDQNGLIVGELHVDTASCDNPGGYAEFGKFDVAWSVGLDTFLDAAGTGATELGGMDASFCGSPGPRLVAIDRVVDDSLGFTNGNVDPGESFLLEIELENEGPLDATSISGTLSTSHPLVTVQDPSATWADLPSGARAYSDAPHFMLDVDPTFPCGESIPLQLASSATEGSWNGEILLPSGTPLGLQQPPPFADDMESGPNGWTTQELIGASPWTQVTDQSTSPTHSWFVPNLSGVRDSVLVMPTIVAVPPRATLGFAHLMNTESGDGGVLEYSTDGFTWFDAEERITLGSYNSVISVAFSSPLAGRKAWAGDPGGWRAVEVDLTDLEGETLTLRWRFASDTFSGGVGWYVDDVVLDAPVLQCVTCTDLDNDGFCPSPDGADCDDGDPDVYPGAPQLCDGVNNDCDDPSWPALPLNEIDADLDGLTTCAGDCNGLDPTIRSGLAEQCDGRDNDCDGLVDNAPSCDPICEQSEIAGGDVLVTDHPSTSVTPTTAWNGAGYGVVWSDARDGNLEVYFSLLDESGLVDVSEVRVTDAVADSLQPTLVWTGEGYGVAWCDERSGPPDAYFARLDDSGVKIASDVLLGSCFASADTTIAWSGSEYGVAWVSAAGEVLFARLDAVGHRIAGETRLSDGSGNARSPSLAWTGSEYGLAWSMRDAGNTNQIYFARLDAAGSPVGADVAVTVNAVQSRRPSLTASDGGYGVTWNEGTGTTRTIHFVRLGPTGSPLGAAVQLTASATGTQRPSLAWSGAEYAVTWRDLRDGDGEIYLARVDASGQEVGSEIRLSTSVADSIGGAVARSGAGYAVVWSETPQVHFLRLGCNCVDGDADGLSSCNDNCALTFNPTQSDLDEDLEGDHCDLDDGQIYLTFPTATQVDWQPEQGGDAWNLYRGDLAVLLSSGTYTQLPGSNDLAAQQCGLAVTGASEALAPDPGETAFYLVSGVSGGVEFGLGTDGTGATRTNDNPCP